MSTWYSRLPIDGLLSNPWTWTGRIPVALAVLAFVAYARRFVRLPLAAVAASGMLAGVALGTAFAPSIVGALVGGLIGWALALRVLGTNLPWAYAATRTLLVLVGVGRLGCLLAGCCFGTRSDAPWAAVYPVGTAAQHLHHELGWISEHDASLPVHPVQAYEALVVLAVAAVLPVLRRRVSNDRALAASVASGYLILRAGLDPLRGMVNTQASVHAFGPVSVAQLEFLGAALAVALLGVGLTRRRALEGVIVEPSLVRTLATWLVTTAAFGASQSALPPFVAAFSACVIGGAGLLLVRDAMLAMASARPRVAIAVSLGLLLLLPAGLRASSGQDEGRYWVYSIDEVAQRLVRIGDQTTPPAALAQTDASLNQGRVRLPPTAPGPWPVHRYSDVIPPDVCPKGRKFIVYGGGGYLQRVDDGCNGPAVVYKHVPFAAGVGLGRDAVVSDAPGESWQVRLGILGNRWRQETEDRPRDGRSGVDVMAVVGGMYHWDWLWGGLGVGGIFGAGRSRGPDPYFVHLGQWGFVLPGLYFRVGLPVFGWEVGSGARDQYWPGVFTGFRTTIGSHQFRLGTQVARLGFLEVYGDARLQVCDAFGLVLRLDVPVTADPYPTGSVGLNLGF